MIYRVVTHLQQEAVSVSHACRLLQVSRSGYYAHRSAGPSAKRLQEHTHVKAAFAASGASYGSRRVMHALRDQGLRIGRYRVRTVMREAGLRTSWKRKFVSTTDSRHTLPVAPNVLDRQFDVAEPNRAWVSDITYIRTGQGWLYLAVVLDLYSRRVVGWSMAPTMPAELVMSALTMALQQRRPAPGLVLHSDRGSQYASEDYQALLKQHHVVCSMSRKGNCWDTQSKMASERWTDLTRVGIGRAALALTCRSGFQRSPSVAGPSVCDLIGALYCTVSVLSCEWGWQCAHYNG
ncbi:transposase InsO family protein [Paraburkholderia sp. JPY681]|nr:transposase InsO family protein [Paraburkholderia atlantica]